jgi:thiamine biosynthesis lipoprotein
MRIAVPRIITPLPIDPGATIHSLTGETMGTTWTILLAATPAVDIAALRTAIDARLDALVAELSHWQPASLLCRYNRAPAGSWTSLPPDFATVIATALDIATASGGAFDPAIGRIVDHYGYGPAPGTGTLAEATAASGHRRLDWDAPARRLRQPGGLSLDLSGIAKGYAVDAVAAVLAAQGHRHLLVEIGGELGGHGMRPDGEPWWVDLETPPGIPAAPLRIALHGLSVATSGNYVRGDHNLDPRTARPADNGLRSVSVIHASAMQADAWATALTVLGPDDGPALAARLDLAARFLTSDREILTPALAAMLAD